MKYFQKLKTSEKISLSFSIFGFFSLLLFLFLINITYFFIWYADQKEKSFQSMERNYYETIQQDQKIEDTKNFKEYLLTKDTMIIPLEGDLICSPGVSLKIKEDPEQIKDRYLYRDGEVVYFIYSKYFEDIGEVKVFFDTTPYIDAQVTIIKTGLIFIFLVFILQFFMGRYISGRLLKDLKAISARVKTLDIHSQNPRVICTNMAENDEIRILAEALNSSYDTINTQTTKLKQFLTDVSHEFKTPLMVLSSRLDLLEKKDEKNTLSEKDISKFFTDTRSNIGKLNGLLESLFFLSRIEEQQGCLIKKPLKLKNFVEDKTLHIAQRFPYKELDYIVDILSEEEILVEENTFSILLDNLLSNAMKFAPDTMILKVGYKNNVLSVQDNGPGISQEDREKIWEKFYRKDTNREGFGVGLYLVKRIVDIYEGDICIESELGKGTTFKVVLNELSYHDSNPS